MIKKSIGEAILNTLLKTKRTVTDDESSGNEQAQTDVLNQIEQAQQDSESAWSIFSVNYYPIKVTRGIKTLPEPNSKDGKYPISLGKLQPPPDYAVVVNEKTCWSVAPSDDYIRECALPIISEYLSSWEVSDTRKREYYAPEIVKVNPEYNKNEESAPIFPIGTSLTEERFTFEVQNADKSSILTSFNNMQTSLDNIGNYLSNSVLKDYPDYAQGKLKHYSSYDNSQDKWTELEPPKTKFSLTLHVYNKTKITFALSYAYDYRQTTSTAWGVEETVETSNGSFDYQVETVIQEKDETPTVQLRGWYFGQVLGGITQEFYPKKAYIGLLTEKPEYSEEGKIVFKEVAHKNTATADKVRTYQRMNLFRGIFSDRNVFNEIVTVTNQTEKADKKYLGYAYLDNKEIIMFPEILDETDDTGAPGWGTIVAFALFENEFPTEGEEPYFCGELIQPVVTEKDRVPLFRPNQFQIYLG